MAVNSNNAQVNRNKANAAAQKAKQMSPSVQYAIVQVLPNIINGAFWGFTDMRGIQEHIEAIKNSNGQITARQLGNACLIEVSPQFLIPAVSQIDANAITQKDVQVMTQARADAQIALERFLISKGKASEKMGKPFSGTVGIYCTNDVTTINYKGVSYPAFRVDMQTALSLLHMYGYRVRVNGNFIPADQAANAGQALWSSTILAPTKTGLFIDIVCTYSAAQIKELEKQFKARNNVK